MNSDTKNDNSRNSKMKKSVSFDEYALWLDFKNGNVDAYAVIYQKYFFVLFNYGKKISQDHELVKDCIQELFIKIWNNRENLAETTSIKFYLFTSLRRKLLDVLRKPQLDVVSDQTELSEENYDITEIAEPGEEASSPQQEKVIKALNQLSQHQQKLLDLKFQKNLSNKEIADEMGITIQSVYNAVFKALRSIRKHISSMAIVMMFISI